MSKQTEADLIRFWESKVENSCEWDDEWSGKCSSLSDQRFCEKHRIEKCHCGAQATHSCPDTLGLVCGSSLCDSCQCLTGR